MKKVIIIVLIGIVVLGAAGVYFFIIAPNNAEKAAEEALKPLPENELFMLSLGEAFVANAVSEDNRRLVKTAIVLGLKEEAAIEELTPLTPIIRDLVLEKLREKTADEYLATDIQDNLREELVPLISERLGVDYIQTLYFNDLVLQ